MATAKIQAVIEGQLGGDNCRLDIQDRRVPLALQLPIKLPVSLAPAASKTLWDASASPFKEPRAIMFVTDPEDVYEDGLSRSATTAGSAPKLRLLLTYGTVSDGSGSNTALGVGFDVYRECPLVMPGYEGATDLTGSTARYLVKIEAANNMTSGFGTIRGNLTMFA